MDGEKGRFVRPSERIAQIREEIIDEKLGADKRQVMRDRLEHEARQNQKLDFECLVRYLDERFAQSQKGAGHEKTGKEGSTAAKTA